MDSELYKINTKCNCIEASYELKEGTLHIKNSYSFLTKDSVKIEILEEVIRTIKISSEKSRKIIDLYKYLVDAERLLNILEGAFITLKEIKISGDGNKDDYQIFRDQLMAQRLKYFLSSKIYSIHTDKLANYETVMDASVFESWEHLVDDLGVINQLYLYACSDCRLTSDIICAFLIQISEALDEYLKYRKLVYKKRRSLKECLKLLISNYGTLVFEKENQFNIDKIIQCMVNTRVNIMHIKYKQKKPCFDGKECVLYSIKMSYLYRIIILKLLGIDEKAYLDNLKRKVKNLNSWNEVLNGLIKRIS